LTVSLIVLLLIVHRMTK